MGHSLLEADGLVDSGSSLRERMRIVERRDWWLWLCAVLITLILTGGIV